MVGSVTSTSIEVKENTSFFSGKSSSVDASYSDPDLLIREYFLSSSQQRAISREIIAQRVSSPKSVFEILSRGASGKSRDGYDGAVNLLAEISDFNLLASAAQGVQTVYYQLVENSSTQLFAENFLEILIKAIACAYKTNAEQRLKLLLRISISIDSRLIKAAIIDALTIISDEINSDSAKAALERFTSDPDPYIQKYVLEALKDIG